MNTTETAITTDNDVRIIAIGDDFDGVHIAVIPADETGPEVIEIEGAGPAAIADGGLRLDRELAVALVTELSELLLGL